MISYSLVKERLIVDPEDWDVEMMSADQWMLTQLGLTWQLVEARGGAAESLSGAWGRVWSPMAARYPRMCRSALDDLSGTFKNEIGAIFVAVMQMAVVYAV